MYLYPTISRSPSDPGSKAEAKSHTLIRSQSDPSRSSSQTDNSPIPGSSNKPTTNATTPPPVIHHMPLHINSGTRAPENTCSVNRCIDDFCNNTTNFTKGTCGFGATVAGIGGTFFYLESGVVLALVAGPAGMLSAIIASGINGACCK